MSVKLKEPDKFKQLLSRNGYSVNRFAKEIGGVPGSFDKYTKGAGMRPERAQEIADKLGIKGDDIFLY